MVLKVFVFSIAFTIIAVSKTAFINDDDGDMQKMNRVKASMVEDWYGDTFSEHQNNGMSLEYLRKSSKREIDCKMTPGGRDKRASDSEILKALKSSDSSEVLKLLDPKEVLKELAILPADEFEVLIDKEKAKTVKSLLKGTLAGGEQPSQGDAENVDPAKVSDLVKLANENGLVDPKQVLEYFDANKVIAKLGFEKVLRMLNSKKKDQDPGKTAEEDEPTSKGEEEEPSSKSKAQDAGKTSQKNNSTKKTTTSKSRIIFFKRFFGIPLLSLGLDVEVQRGY